VQVVDPAKLEVLLHGKSRDPDILRIALEIWLYMARGDIRVHAIHLIAPLARPGANNHAIPDKLFRQWE
jgi:hypothetical protein